MKHKRSIEASAIESITKGPRQSNFELLRIVAMFLVLVVHADFWSLGAPTIEEYELSPIPSATRTLFQFLSIICVDTFVAISGWFSIKPTTKGALSFIFQCVFLTTFVYILLIFLGVQRFTLGGIRECLLLTRNLWFGKAYFALYICAPILNAFCEHASKKQFLYLLAAFYIFQSTYGMLGAAPFIMGGYSFFSFVGIYLSARFIRIYKSDYPEALNRKFIIGGGISLIVSYILYIVPRFMGFVLPEFFLSYINPCVVWASLSMLLMFSKINIGSIKWLNWISASTFAVYIIHQSPFIAKPYFVPLIRSVYENTSGVACLAAIAMTLVAIFLLCIVIDQPRKYIWNKIASHFQE